MQLARCVNGVASRLWPARLYSADGRPKYARREGRAGREWQSGRTMVAFPVWHQVQGAGCDVLLKRLDIAPKRILAGTRQTPRMWRVRV